jgi:cytidylate kinase
MSLPNIIGICGKKYHGKDTVANHLVQKYGYKRIAFADPIKDICQIVFGLSIEQLNSYMKEEIDDYWKISPRNLMQFIGTDLFRNNMATIMPNIGDNIWIHVLIRKISNEIQKDPNIKFVITDVRFDNELEYIAKLNGLKIKVQRNNIINNDHHESESYTDKLNVDYILNNDDTIDDLYIKIDELLNQLKL